MSQSIARQALTVDVEDWFQVQAYAGVIDRADWDRLPRRVEENTHWLLDLFAQNGARCTFFTLGWVAERHPGLVRRIVTEGHELASHGYFHRLAHEQSPADFLADVRDAKARLEDVGGVAIRGYRAPTFSINRRNPWAFDVLAQCGYRYSSSVFPIRHDLYGVPDAPRAPYHPLPGNPLVEIPMTTLRLFGRNWPLAGGGYFRLMPYALYAAALRHVGREQLAGQAASALFYTHPWEIDPGQPRVPAAPLKSRIRHHLNLSRMRGRMGRLVRDFAWGRMDEVFAAALAGTMGGGPGEA